MKIKKIQVVMLEIPYSQQNKTMVNGTIEMFNNRLTISKGHKESNPFERRGSKQQHLYFSSDDEIKEGDWVIGGLNDILEKWEPHFKANWKKIISSTDESLGLPEPPKEWIEYFVSEYNKGNIITEVMVEYERYKTYELDANSKEMWDFKYQLKTKPDNTIIISPVEETWDDVYSKYESFRFYHPQISFIQWLKQNNYKVIKS